MVALHLVGLVVIHLRVEFNFFTDDNLVVTYHPRHSVWETATFFYNGMLKLIKFFFLLDAWLLSFLM